MRRAALGAVEALEHRALLDRLRPNLHAPRELVGIDDGFQFTVPGGTLQLLVVDGAQ